MKLSVFLLCALATVQAALLAAPSADASKLELGYYNKKCKGKDGGVEDVVRKHVTKAIKENHRIGASLVRLIFHDCFVRGCDASVLLDESTQNPYPEKGAPKNTGLDGFELLEQIKADVEGKWPGVVSCADILVYAARDATSILSNGNINYEVPAGRLDGLVSKYSDAEAELPGSDFTAKKLIENFRSKNFTAEELVILSGAHSIGVCHCSAFTDRLTAPPNQINPGYRNLLNDTCDPSTNSVPNNFRDDDYETVKKYMPEFSSEVRTGKDRDFLDNTYYLNNLNKSVNFDSDWQLLINNETRGHVKEYADDAALWNSDFAKSMLKLSMLPMPAESNQGGIRKKCSAVYPLY